MRHIIRVLIPILTTLQTSTTRLSINAILRWLHQILCSLPTPLLLPRTARQNCLGLIALNLTTLRLIPSHPPPKPLRLLLHSLLYPPDANHTRLGLKTPGLLRVHQETTRKQTGGMEGDTFIVKSVRTGGIQSQAISDYTFLISTSLLFRRPSRQSRRIQRHD